MDFLPKKDRSEMSASAQLMMREYAGQRWPSLNHKARMSRLAGLLAIGHRRVRAIYQGDPSVRLRADEMAAIEALRQQRAEEANRAEFEALSDRIAQLEAAFARIDPEHIEPHLAALRSAVDGRREHDLAEAPRLASR
jgi:hypothetical protein